MKVVFVDGSAGTGLCLLVQHRCLNPGRACARKRPSPGTLNVRGAGPAVCTIALLILYAVLLACKRLRRYWDESNVGKVPCHCATTESNAYFRVFLKGQHWTSQKLLKEGELQYHVSTM